MAVSALDAASSGNTDGASYTVSAGSNRLLVIGIQHEGNFTTDQVTVTWGGQSLTEGPVGYIDAGGNDQEVQLFYLNEAGIAAASGSTISITNESANFTWHARSYQDVDQTTPVPETNNASTGSSTPNPLTTSDIVAGDGSAVCALGGCGNATAASWGTDLTERTQQDDSGTTTTTGSFADAFFATGQTVNVECTWTSQNRAAVCAMEIAPAAAGPAVTDVDTDEQIEDGQLNVVITGTGFGGTTGEVYITNNATKGAGTEVRLAVDSWADTSIQVDIQEHTTGNPIGDDLDFWGAEQLYVIVVHNDTTASTGFAITMTAQGRAAENTNFSANVNETIVLAIQVHNTGGPPVGFKWQYNHESGGWTDITTVSSNVKAVTPATFTNDAATTDFLTAGTGTHEAGVQTADGTVTDALSNGGYSNYTIAIQGVGADVANNETTQIRLVENDGTAFTTYTQTPTITWIEAGGGPPPAAHWHLRAMGA